MEFQGREIPEHEFRALTRRIFFDLLAELRENARATKTAKWWNPTEQTEQAMFNTWLKSLGVRPFPLVEGDSAH